jgi:hypothetical protein
LDKTFPTTTISKKHGSGKLVAELKKLIEDDERRNRL